MSRDETDLQESSSSDRAIFLQIDNIVSNPVLSAGPEQHETKDVPLSKLEQFFVDLHNVFLEESTAKEKSSPEGDLSLNVPQNPIVQADQFIHMAKYQMDNLVQLIDTVVNRTGLTFSRVAPTSRQAPSQDALLMTARTKRTHLRLASEMLSRGAASIRSSCEISRTSVDDLNRIGRFFHVVQNSNGGMAVNLSLQPTKPSLVALIQGDDGRFTAQGGTTSNLIADLKTKFHAGLYRLVYDSISTNKSFKMHRLADRIVWKDTDFTVEISPDLTVSGTEFSLAVSVRLITDLLVDLRKRNFGEHSQPSSSHFLQVMQFIEHEHVCSRLSSLFSRLVASHRHVLNIRELYSDSLLHSGWCISLRNSFLAEVIVENAEVIVRCLSSSPCSAYQARCCNIFLVELVIVNAVQQRL